VSLAEILQRAGIDAVDVVGLATDHCVRATALDAKAVGFAVRVLSPLVAGVAPDSSARALDDLRAAGITVV
jgi:nicotinamidase/pyrazinamidase